MNLKKRWVALALLLGFVATERYDITNVNDAVRAKYSAFMAKKPETKPEDGNAPPPVQTVVSTPEDGNAPPPVPAPTVVQQGDGNVAVVQQAIKSEFTTLSQTLVQAVQTTISNHPVTVNGGFTEGDRKTLNGIANTVSETQTDVKNVGQAVADLAQKVENYVLYRDSTTNRSYYWARVNGVCTKVYIAN